MTKYTTLALTLLAAGALCAGYGIVRACTAGAIHSAQDRCLEAPACSYTMYYFDNDLFEPADGAVCQTCSTYYQGCDTAATNSLAASALWAQFWQAPYSAVSNRCGTAVRVGPPQYISPPNTNYQTFDSGCGELTGPAAGRPIQWPIFVKPPRQPASPTRQP
jgi:hypothetical protein